MLHILAMPTDEHVGECCDRSDSRNKYATNVKVLRASELLQGAAGLFCSGGSHGAAWYTGSEHGRTDRCPATRGPATTQARQDEVSCEPKDEKETTATGA